MKSIGLAALVAALAFAAFSSDALAVEVTGGVVANPIGRLVGPAVEFSGGPHAGFEVQALSLYYDYRDSSYEEEGSGLIGVARGRFYPMAASDGDKFWVSGGLALVSVSWEWWDISGGAITDHDTDSGIGIAPELGLGWKFRAINRHLVIDPQLLVAYIAGTGSKTNIIAGGGLSLGWRF